MALANDGEQREYDKFVADSAGNTSVRTTLGTVTVSNSHTGSDELRVYQENHICVQNTTTELLGSNEAFTGDWQDCLNYQEVNVSVDTDQNSATNGLVIQWSADALTIADTDSFSVYANSGTNYTPNPAFRYVRVVYTNGAVAQTRFSLMTILRRGVTGGSFHRIDSTLKDDSDARLNITVPKLKTAANTYVSQTATTAGNAKMSLEEYDVAFDTAPLPVQIQTAGVIANVEARKQTPTGNALNVQIGPGDVISNIPVVIDFDHHQDHEGESYRISSQQLSIGASTIKYSATVPVILNPDATNCPHLLIECDVYNGSCRVDTYEGSTITGGSPLTAYNVERNIANSSTLVVKSGITSTDGTLIDSFFAGGGSRTTGEGRAGSEWILKANTSYRIDVVGLAAGTQAIIRFKWYEDLGV